MITICADIINREHLFEVLSVVTISDFAILGYDTM
jgi:hypothetical protein